MSSLLIICAKRYNGHELWTLLGVLQERGHKFEVVSQDTLIQDELTLRPNIIERTVWQVDIDESRGDKYDAVVVVSGNMSDTEKYWTDNHVINLLKAFKAEGKVCAAICCSVPTLAPIATGVKVSFFPLLRSRQRLTEFGALLQPVSLTVDQDHRMITAENQMLTQMWGNEICNMLEGKPPTNEFKPTEFMPKGFERKMLPEVREAIDKARGYKMVLRKPEVKHEQS
jgi:putative intracellular protease/amidase